MMTKDLLKVTVLVVLIASVLIFIVWSKDPDVVEQNGGAIVDNIDDMKNDTVLKVKGVIKEIRPEVASSGTETNSAASGNTEKTKGSESESAPATKSVPKNTPVYDESHRLVNKTENGNTSVAASLPMNTVMHTVKSGESLWVIAKKYYGSGAKSTKIADANPGMGKVLSVGQQIRIPEVANTPGNDMNKTYAISTTANTCEINLNTNKEEIVSAPAGKNRGNPENTSANNATGFKKGATYVVQKGDTLEKVAQKHYGSRKYWALIAEANGIKDARKVREKQVLNLPELPESAAVVNIRTANNSHENVNHKMRSNVYPAGAGATIHVVKSGDTLIGISRKYFNSRKKIDEIIKANNLKDKNHIYVGQKLVIPAA